jgi:energy-coupling factor transporter ATP-binding protein EcfA2
MYVTQLSLSGIKCFGRSQNAEVTIDLERPDGTLAGWTVLAGRNGSGKSTLLRAIALAVAGPDNSRALQGSFGGWISRDRQDAHFEVKLRYSEHDTYAWDDREKCEWTTSAGLSLSQSESRTETKIGRFRRHQNSDKLDMPIDDGPWRDDPNGWFISGFGPFRRLTGGDPPRSTTTKYSNHRTCLESLFDERIALTSGLSMLQAIHTRSLEQREGEEQLLTNLLALLNDGLLPDDTRAIRVDSDGLWVRQAGVDLLLQELSDGYQVVIALVLDLARQLRDRYLAFDIVHGSDGSCQVQHPGVVLIDEIDSHLHISWQKKIGFWMKTHFPELQFIVTTHSPFVCQAADPRGLIRLPGPGDEGEVEHVPEDVYYTVVNGGADDAVLTQLFDLGVPHSDASEQLRERIAYLEAKELRDSIGSTEMRELGALRGKLPQSPSALLAQAVRKLGR